MTSYIENKVVPEDRRKMSMETNLAAVCEHLTRVSQFTVHYRVRRNGEIQFYYMKCARIGDADDFESIVFAFANEDIDVRRNELSELLKPGGTASKRKVLIVEDNELNREILSSVLSENFEVLMAEDGEEGLKLLAGHYRDLSVILLDICMPDALGTEIARKIQSKSENGTDIVFLTTSPDFAVEAFSLHVSDYLTKPYTKERLTDALDRVMEKRRRRLYVPIRCENEIRRIDLHSVVYIEARNHRLEIHLKSGNCLETRMTLKELKERFQGIGGFTTVGASYIVNLRCVQSISSAALEMTGGGCIPVPRRLRGEVKKQYFDFYTKEAIRQ